VDLRDRRAEHHDKYDRAGENDKTSRATDQRQTGGLDERKTKWAVGLMRLDARRSLNF
jgi:hypothetical protein